MVERPILCFSLQMEWSVMLAEDKDETRYRPVPFLYTCVGCVAAHRYSWVVYRGAHRFFLCRYKLSVASIYTAKMAALMCSDAVTAILKLNACLSSYAPHEMGGECCQMCFVFFSRV